MSAPKRCFIITPIGDEGSDERRHADMVKHVAIEPAFAQKGFIVSRADQSSDPTMINDYVFEMITEAEICIADLSFLNPNVFYELGVRHAVEKPVIHIAQNGTKIPFDNSGHRVTFFDRQDVISLGRLKDALISQIDYICSPDYRLSNPLTQARGRQSLVRSSDSSDQLLADLSQRITRLEKGVTTSGVALGIQGQGELATMSVPGLVERLKSQGVGVDPKANEVIAMAAAANSNAAAAHSVAVSVDQKVDELARRFSEVLDKK